MSISKTKEQIVACPDDGRVVLIDFSLEPDVPHDANVIEPPDLKALADSHTKLLEAAKMMMVYWDAVQLETTFASQSDARATARLQLEGVARLKAAIEEAEA